MYFTSFGLHSYELSEKAPRGLYYGKVKLYGFYGEWALRVKQEMAGWITISIKAVQSIACSPTMV